VEIPLSQHIGIPSAPIVKDGDSVSAGEMIASAQDGLSLPQHASISGRVTLGNGKIIIDKVR
jgi:Na+-translocating ferredoxin:NAD+ oxidoreductase RnfC subunit